MFPFADQGRGTAMAGTGAGQVDQLGVVVEGAGALINSVREDQWDNPTPCPGWTVRDVVDHLAGGNYRFAEALGAEDEPASPTPGVPAGILDRYHRSARALMEAFRRPGALERTLTVPFGTVPGVVALHLRTTELLAHGWDVARATGQVPPFPEEIAEQELAFSRSKLADVPPDRRPFAPSQPATDDLPAIDRLAACLGRPLTPPPG